MNTGSPSPLRPITTRRAGRIALIVAGSLSLALGVVGIAVPVLPTTPFLLLAAICYGRSSGRSYRWLLTNRLFGRYVDDYLHGRRISWKVKTVTLILLWGVITLSAVLFVSQWWVRALLFVVAVGVTVHIVTLRGREDRRQRMPES
jgi:uncharacterized membrane protein YbaN (DUF454 family)